MENQLNQAQSQPTSGGSKAGMWIFILAVIVIIAGGAHYFLTRDNSNNTNNLNTNAVVNENVNTETNTNEVTNTNTTVDTSNWKMYESSDQRFGFKYPSDWTIVDLPDPKAGIALRSPSFVPLDLGGSVISEGDIYVSTISNPNMLSILDLINTFSDASRSWPQEFPYRTISVSEIDSLEFPSFQASGDSFNRNVVFVPLDNQVVSFSYLFTEAKYVNVFKSILDTFSRSN